MSSTPLIEDAPGDWESEKAVSGGSFVVTQTHLGFCPPDVKLEIRQTGMVLLDDEHMVCSYPFTDLVMWSQSRAEVTVLLMKNLRRVIFTARSRWHARRIVLKLHEVTESIAGADKRKGKGAGVEEDELGLGSASMTISKSMLESVDDTRHEGAKMFRVQQTHLHEAPDICILIVDENGIGLLDRDTGKIYHHISWFQLLLWRADAGAIVLILNHSNQQIELLTPSGPSIAKAMTAHALAVRETLAAETVERTKLGQVARYAKAPLEFRRELIQFEPQQGRGGARASATEGVDKRGCTDWLRHFWGSRSDDFGRIHAREQLHAIFSSVDTDGSNTLGLDELAELLRSLNIYNETTNRELSTNELQLLMIEMDAYDNEVTFDGFATWAMSEPTGGGGASRLKQGVEHRQKEAEAVAEIFDKLDTDHDGLLDRTDFQNLCDQSGLDISEQGFYRAWATLDVNRVGQISFKDFFSWFKKDSVDAVASNMIRAMRTTRLLVAAKGAMVFSVDKRNAKARKSLKAMFDSMDSHGTGDVGLVEMLTMIDDVGVEFSDRDVHNALTEMNSTGKLGGSITLDDMEVWWCEPPNDTKSGVLRSKLKYAAFRAKAVGAILTVDTNSAGAEDAEKYINDALAAAYKPVLPLHGKSLGIFGSNSSFRKWCQSLIYEHPMTDNALVMLVVVNLILLSSQDYDVGFATSALPRFNFIVMLVFTAEAAMRIIVKGLYYGKEAYLSSWSWDAFDFTILLVIWAVYWMPPEISSQLRLTSNMYLFRSEEDDEGSDGYQRVVDWLSMVRSLRMLRFFASIRNIISAVTQGRVMMASIVFLFFYLSVIFFVLGYQMYHGVATTQCLPTVEDYNAKRDAYNTTCIWGEEEAEGYDGLWKLFPMCNESVLGEESTKHPCPPTIDCTLAVDPGDPNGGTFTEGRCAVKIPNPASMERLEHIDKYGFDSYGRSLLTLMALITCDDWEKFTRAYDRVEVLSSGGSWLFFFCFVVVAALFFVNLFVSGLAYSFIQIRADSRAQRERDQLKKVMVDTALSEGKSQATQAFQKHALQACMPRATRKAKDIMNNPKFAATMRYVIVVNLLFMMMDSWELARAKQEAAHSGHMSDKHLFWDFLLSVGEVLFTLAYSYEIMVKLQAIGFKLYFGAEDTGVLMSNVVDFVIVLTAWPETLMVIADFLAVELAGSDFILNHISNFKILRAFRVMKLVLIIPAVRNLLLKAFKGMDTILSLIMLIIFVLTLAAITGMNLFSGCQTETALRDSKENFDAHTPNFLTFGQSLMVAFQVMTADDWSPLMFKYMDCETWGDWSTAVSAFYFISLVTLCYFILSNLFIAIFIENFKLADEVKRDMQVRQHIEGLTMGSTEAKDGGQWVNSLREGFQGIEDMMGETSTINVLRRRTANEFMRGARVTGRLTKKEVSKAHRFTRGDEDQREKTQLNQKLASCCACFEKFRPKERYEGMNQSDRVKAWKMKALGQSGTLSPANGAWKTRAFHKTLQANGKFQTCVYVVIFASTVQTVMRADEDSTFVDFLLLLFFGVEFMSKTVAYGFLGGPDYDIWPYKSTIFELFLLVTQVLTFMPDDSGLSSVKWLAAALQPFRVVRYMYLYEGFRVQVDGLAHAIAAVWTALFLLAISFFFFGIIGMELFKGKLHTCESSSKLSESECFEAAGDFDSRAACLLTYGCDGGDTCVQQFCDNQWKAATFNFDSISQALQTLVSVWSLAGWTTLWYTVMDAPSRAGDPPEIDNSMTAAFLYFFAFILVNSFLMTKLVTSMLCDFFAQKSGSDKTTDQRNWNFMSIFLVDALKLEVIKPPEKHRLRGCALWCYRTIHHRLFKIFVEIAIVLSVVAVFGEQQLECADETSGYRSHSCTMLYTLDACVLSAFWIEFLLTLVGVGSKKYLENYRLVGIVLATMSFDTMWYWMSRLTAKPDESMSRLTTEIGMWLRTANCIRALRVVTVLKRVHPIKKIVFLVGVAADKVLTLFLLMTAVFVIFAYYARMLCHGVFNVDVDVPMSEPQWDLSPDGAINAIDNFETTETALGVLWQICTGQSMMGANKECAEWYLVHDNEWPVLRSTSIYIFFDSFFFVANMLFLNLFIALLLDFDLMGSEDMAVSDKDLLLFKKFWNDNETGKGDISSGLLAERRTIHSVIHLHELKDFVLGMADRNVGTFSMMPRADTYYFNRVLYELKKSQQDVVDSASGSRVHTMPFFDVLYALCHIRFSSSCLSLAEEVEKSLEMVEYIENHAAKVIQVAGRAFCARRSVNVSGIHAPPGCVWPVPKEHHSDEMDAVPHAEPGVSRCKVCTLPNEDEYLWCACVNADFSSKSGGLMSESILEMRQHSPRPKAAYKEQWDVSVNCALLFEMHSLIQTERLTPEHLVAEEFDRQAAEDRKKQASWMGLVNANAATANQGRVARFLTRGVRKREEKIERLQLRGLHLMAEQSWASAAKQFSDALDLDPENVEQIIQWKEECERKERTLKAKKEKERVQKQNRKDMLKSKDSMARSVDKGKKSMDEDLDEAPLKAAVRAVFSLTETTVITNFSHMHSKKNKKLVHPSDFMKGLVELASATRSTLTRNQLEVLMRTIDQMPCSDYPGGDVNYRTFAEMVCSSESLNEFCDAVVCEGAAMKVEKRRQRKGKMSKSGMTRSDMSADQMQNSMFASQALMTASFDKLVSQDGSMEGGSSLDDDQGGGSDEEAQQDTSRFYCPILKELMVDPVLACDGYSYERYAFQDLWSDHGQTIQKLEKRMSPVTGELLENDQTEPNHRLRKEIAAWKEAEEKRAKKRKDKARSIKERTRRLKQESEDMQNSFDAQAAGESGGPNSFRMSVLGPSGLEPPVMFQDFSSMEIEQTPDSGGKKKRFGLGGSKKKTAIDETRDLKKFSNPLDDAQSPTANPHLVVSTTGDAFDDAAFESEFAGLPQTRQVTKLSSMRTSMRNSIDGKTNNPMALSGDLDMKLSRDSSAEEEMFEMEARKQAKAKAKKDKKDKKKSKKKDKKEAAPKKAGGAMRMLNPLSVVKGVKPEAIAQYKAVHNTPCHQGSSLSSEVLLAGIYAGDVISVTERVRVDGMMRVKCERGWASVTDSDGEVFLEIVDNSEYWYTTLNAVNLRTECDHRSRKVTYLLKNEEVATKQHTEIETEIENGQVRVDVWVQCADSRGTMGWAALKDADGQPQMQFVDKFDELRYQLRKLSFEALTRQAVSINADAAQVAKAMDFNRCIDPRNALIEIIKHLYEHTVPVLDLKELPPGWDGSETGRLAEGERVKVDMFGATLGRDEDDGAIGDDLRALHDKRGYVLYELPHRGLHGSYEVKIDKIRRTVVLPRENLIKQEDEMANKGLFKAVLINDVENLRKLLERTEKPSDALDRRKELIPRLEEAREENDSDKWRTEPGVLRVVESVNSNDTDFDREYFDKTLYEVACLKAAEQHEPLPVKLLLMEKLLLKAVVLDDLTSTIQLLEEDGEIHVQPMLRAACSEMGPWGSNPPTPVLELARRIWKEGGYGHHGGMANTLDAAVHLGGQCWLYLSKKFAEEYGEEFNPAVHTVEKMQQMHGALSKKQMKKRFGGKKDAVASEEQTEQMLEWKARTFS